MYVGVDRLLPDQDPAPDQTVRLSQIRRRDVPLLALGENRLPGRLRLGHRYGHQRTRQPNADVPDGNHCQGSAPPWAWLGRSHVWTLAPGSGTNISVAFRTTGPGPNVTVGEDYAVGPAASTEGTCTIRTGTRLWCKTA